MTVNAPLYQQANIMPPTTDLQPGSETSYNSLPGVDRTGAGRTLWNFIWMSVFFSANHGCVVACLSLATARLGAVGAWQSGILYITYTGSAVLGATYVVKQLGPRNAIMAGMALYCVYVGCFLAATLSPAIETPAALLGAAIGGIGAGFLWTAQGSYFGRAAEDHAAHLQQPVQESNQRMASIFAFIYLAEEVALRSLSTLLLEWDWAWSAVFGSYTAVALVSTVTMLFVYDYPTQGESSASSLEESTNQAPASTSNSSVWYKVTAAWQLLRGDSKMKYMIGLNAVFGLTAAFLNSYVNGEVVRVVTNDNNSKSVGLFNAWVSCVAAIMSLLFGRISKRIGNGPILILGAICFFSVVFPFAVVPDTKQWSVIALIFVYTFHGCGRATFEGTLKATFADYFAYEKEGAFANIILQNGFSGAIGYILTFTLLCSEESRYCVRYSNGSLHDVFSFEMLVILSAVAAIVGYMRASHLRQVEERSRDAAAASLEDTAMLSLPRNQNE
jgi:MFS family permease